VLLNEKWYRRPQLLVAAGVFALTLLVYVLTLNPTAPFWDAGEFITTSHIVGVPHQPGTPLYVLVGRVFDVVFGQADITTPSMHTAWAVNFMSAFFSALAVTFIYLLIWELARRSDPDSGWMAHAGGVVGAFFLAFSQTFWNNAIEAEVYGLGAFMLALLSWLALRWYDYRDQEGSNNLLLLMVYLLGLGVGFHLGTLLVYPGVFLVVVLATRRQLPLYDLLLMSAGLALFLFSTVTKNNDLVMVSLAVYAVVVGIRAAQGRHFALVGSALFFIGLSVHLMMMMRAGASPEPYVNQTDPDNFATLMSVIRREQYPPINPFERRADIGWQYGYYYHFLMQQFYFLGDGHSLLTRVSTVICPIFLALVGLFQGLRRVRPLIYVPLVNYLINGEILTLYLNFTDHEVRDRDYFYFAAFMFFAVFIGMGAAALLRYAAGAEGISAAAASEAGRDWRRGIPRVKTPLVTVIMAVVLVGVSVLPAVPGSTKYFEHDNSENRIAYEYAWNILAGLDQNTILFTNGDNDTFPIWYLQQVERFRRDVTVVNLSLANLPWYVKQLKHDAERPLAMKYSDGEIDRLQHKVFEDRKTGKRTYSMIKDQVVADIVNTNYKDAKLPVFFAVTIPQDNMAMYFPYLQMEGMAYRLTYNAAPNDQPTTDAQKVLENMLGVYQMSALLDGDTLSRHEQYRSLVGAGGGQPLDLAGLETLKNLLGHKRTDVYRNTNATHLLGNYPAALSRAGYQAYMDATAAAATDTSAYQAEMNKAMLAFEASMIVEPYNPQALEFYPLLLVQMYRDSDAKAFLSSLRGSVPEEVEERTIYSALRGFARGGVPQVAFDWLDGAIDETPDRKFYYQVKFAMHQGLNHVAESRAVIDAWEAVHGERDPEMVQGLADLEKSLRIEEQNAVDQAVKNGMGGQ